MDTREWNCGTFFPLFGLPLGQGLPGGHVGLNVAAAKCGRQGRARRQKKKIKKLCFALMKLTDFYTFQFFYFYYRNKYMVYTIKYLSNGCIADGVTFLFCQNTPHTQTPWCIQGHGKKCARRPQKYTKNAQKYAENAQINVQKCALYWKNVLRTSLCF